MIERASRPHRAAWMRTSSGHDETSSRRDRATIEHAPREIQSAHPVFCQLKKSAPKSAEVVCGRGTIEHAPREFNQRVLFFCQLKKSAPKSAEVVMWYRAFSKQNHKHGIEHG